ncbi:MAG TPA: VWA domain-containing protein [Vicinamibacterales bacterium]
MRTGRLTALLAFALVAPLLAAAVQEPPAPQDPQARFRAEANLVRVDAYPTLDGKPVLDLTADDFEIFEDGKPQTLASFEHIQIVPGGSQEARREPNTVRESRAMAEDPRARLFVVFLDTYFTEIDGSYRVQRGLVNMLDRMLGENDLFAVMTPQMSARDLAFARRSVTVEGYLSKYWFWGQRHRLFPEDEIERRYLDCYGDIGEPGVASSLAREMIERRREKLVIEALTDLTLQLRHMREERTAVIVVSNGWLLYRENPRLLTEGPQPRPGHIGTTPGAGRVTVDRVESEYGYSQYQCDADRQTLAYTDIWQLFQDLIDQANRSNVSFYPLDSRGLAAFDDPIAAAPMRRPTVRVDPRLPVHEQERLKVEQARREQIAADLRLDTQHALVRNRVESLRALAVNTDGLAIVDTNDLDGGFRRIADDLTSYYLLGYYSTNKKLDGKFRKITVRVKRPGVKVRARRGYRALSQEEIEEGARETAEAAAAVPPSAVQAALNSIGVTRPGIPLRTAVSYAVAGTAGGPSRRVRLWTLAELDARMLREGPWLGGGDIDIMVAAGDGSPLASKTVALPAAQRAIAIDLGEIDLPAGETVIRTRVRPRGDGLSISDTLRLPPSYGESPTGVPLLLRRGPTTGAKYVPTADRQFRRTERLRLDLPVFAPVISATAELLDRTGNPMSVPVATSSRVEENVNWATAEIVLAPLAAGDYAIKLAAELEGTRADIVTGFRVVP